MIIENIILIAAIASPALVLVLIRTNAAIAFFSLCAGALLVRFVSDEAQIAGTVLSNNSQAASQYAELALLLLPVVFSALLLRKTIPASKTALNVLPAAAVGLVGVLLAAPLLPGNVQTAITGVEGWKILQQHRAIVVAASVLVSLVALWISYRGSSSGKKRS